MQSAVRAHANLRINDIEGFVFTCVVCVYGMCGMWCVCGLVCSVVCMVCGMCDLCVWCVWCPKKKEEGVRSPELEL